MHLRLIADDLTGALDTAARFVARTGPVAVYWAPPPADAFPNTLLGAESLCGFRIGLCFQRFVSRHFGGVCHKY